MIEVKIKGLEKFQRGLKSLPLKIAQKILRQSLKEGADKLLQTMVSKVPVGDTGNLADSLKVKLKKINSWEWAAISGSFESRGKKGVPGAWYARLVEYG